MQVMTTEKFLGLLNTIKSEIEEKDSFEGSISYTYMDETLKEGEVAVTASIRVGNSQGQGGMYIL